MHSEQFAWSILSQAAVHAALAAMLLEIKRRQSRADYLRYWGYSSAVTALGQVLSAAMLLTQNLAAMSTAAVASAVCIAVLSFLQAGYLVLSCLSLTRRPANHPGAWLTGALISSVLAAGLAWGLSGSLSQVVRWSLAWRHLVTGAAVAWFAFLFRRAFGAGGGRATRMAVTFSLLSALNQLALLCGDLNRSFPWHVYSQATAWVGTVLPLGLTVALVVAVVERAESTRREFASIWESTIEAMRMSDMQGRIVRVNDSFCRLFGKPRGELIGQPMSCIYDPRESARIEAGYRSRTGLDRSLFPLRRGFDGLLWNGRRICVDASHALLETPDGPMVLSVFRDDTARRATEEALRDSQERLQLALDSTNDALFDWHVPERVVDVNPRYYHMLGYELGDIELRPAGWIRLVHPEDYPRVRRDVLMRLDVSMERFDVEYRMRTKPGDYIWVRMRGKVTNRDESGRPLRIAGTLMEITDRKQAEQELARTTELAQAAARAKSAFLANMSHEIRTPLTAILGLIQLLDDEPLPERANEAVGLMRQAGESLMGIINDILELSQIEAGVKLIRLAPYDPAAGAAEAVSLLRHNAEKRRLELRLEVAADLPALVEGDAARIRQVLLNLLSNALKFTEQGRVVLRVETGRDSNAEPVLAYSVTDTGIGIEPALQQQLFRPFTQADTSASRRHGGTGLGLAISRRLVEQMGGQIQLESEPGRGSKFSFTLPLRLAQAVEPETTPKSLPKPEVTGRLRVLVAEDNAVNRLIAERMLGRFGVHPQLASDGHEAVELALRNDYDLVLMDVQMPGLDGMAAAQQIRQRADWQPHIVALTAHVLPEDREACLRAGMNGFLSKPLELQALGALLEELAVEAGTALPV